MKGSRVDPTEEVAVEALVLSKAFRRGVVDVPAAVVVGVATGVGVRDLKKRRKEDRMRKITRTRSEISDASNKQSLKKKKKKLILQR